MGRERVMSRLRNAADAAYNAAFRFWAQPVLLADGRQAWHVGGSGDVALVEPADGGESERVRLDSLTAVSADDAASWPARSFPGGTR
jgi:hypothetical protein